MLGLWPRQMNTLPITYPAIMPRRSRTLRPQQGTIGRCRRFSNKDGYSFFFYSNDHAPIHVHVRRGGGEAVFVVEPEVELRESVGFNVSELSRAEDLIDDNLELIKQKWAEHLG